MDAARVVMVRPPDGVGDGAGGWGSGYVVAPRLVLTSAHVTPGVGARVDVVAAGTAIGCGGVVVWRGRPGERDDAALVEVDDPRWVPPQGRPLRWGRVVTNRPGIECQAWGFPAFMQRPGRAPETAQPSGWLNPGDRYVGDRYVMTLAGQAPLPPIGEASPWSGLSGAALYCGDLLTGVVAADPAGSQHAAVETTPISVLCRVEGFRAVLARHDVPDLLLEPVELQKLAEPETDVRSPAALLRARQHVVAFRGREQLLAALLEWADGSGFAAQLIHGPGGQGKTRLAHEFATRLGAQRWASLWLNSQAPAEQLEVLADAAVPLLVIVDYAETRPDQVAAAIRACARHSGTTPVRMLLLARTAEDWWERLRAADHLVDELLDGTSATLLPTLAPETEDRREAYAQAVVGFTAALPRLPGQHDRHWSGIARQLPTPNLAHASLASALTLHMTALADLLDTADRHTAHPPGVPRSAADPVEKRLLAHERRYWQAAARRHAPLRELGEPTLDEALTAALLLGADDRDTADALLRRVPGLQDQSRERRDTIRRWIAEVYPPLDNRPWGSLQPDRLTEWFVGTQFDANPALADPLVAGVTPNQATQLLTIYGRAAHQPAFHNRLGASLTALVIHHSDALAQPAIEVATQLEAPGPLITALRHLTTNPDIPLEFLVRLADQLPQASHNLAEWATQLTQRLTDHYRQHATNDPDAFLPALAGSLNNLSIRLGDLGRREDALSAITEAADAHRTLAAAHPDAFLPDFARSLNNLSVDLGDLGRREDALEAITEAVRIRRQLATTRPDAFLPDLAGSLNNLAIRLGELGRREDALEAITEAVEIRRRLAAARPDAFLPDLAMSLNNLAIRLGELGRREDALEAITEAVEVRRRLAAARPDAFLPNLAGSLNNLSVDLGELGRREDALEAITEAVDAYRTLAAARPDAFLPDLAASLNNLSVQLGELGRREDALEAITEAVDAYRTLAAARPDAFLPDLAASLNNLSVQLGELGQLEDAVEAITEAVEVRRRLAAARPDAFLPNLAGSLNNLSIRLGELGRREDAVVAITEAVDAYRTLAAARPDAYLPDLAMSLNNLSVDLGELGRREAALEAITEAVEIRRQLAAARPDAYLPDLATSLNNLSILLGELGRREEALEAITEAVQIRRQLAAARPDAYLPDLAMSLNNLSVDLGDLGRRQDALEAITEAVEIRRQLAARWPDAHLDELEQSLQVLAWLDGASNQ